MLIKSFGIKIGEIYFHGSDIIEYSGLQETSVEYEMTENAVGNGTIITGWYMPEREITLTARVPKMNAESVFRYFKGNKNYVLVIGERKINVVMQNVKLNWALTFYNDPRIELSLIAPDPYFYDVSDFGKDIAGIIPQFGFPWTYSPDNPVKFGYREFTDQTIFENDGDAEVGLKLRIEASGIIRGVKFENLRTGQYIKINQDLAQGDILEISTVSNPSETPYIKLNGVDIFDKIDRMSDFFKLAVGDNFLKYSAEEGVTEMNVYLYYSPKYSSGLEDIT